VNKNLARFLKVCLLAAIAWPAPLHAQVRASSGGLVGTFDGGVYFRGGTTETGDELWRSDGSELGTRLVADITPGSDSTSFRGFLSAGSMLYFVTGSKLWKTDGTAAGTVVVKDFGSTNLTLLPERVNGKILIFILDGSTPFPNNHGNLWASDGMTDAAVLLTPGGSSTFQYASSAVAYKGSVYFSGKGGLWRTDGTVAGTVRVKEVPGTWVTELTVADQTLFFRNTTSSSPGNTNIWKSDGTESGSILLKTFGDISYGSAAVGGMFYFAAWESGKGTELWKSDGTAAGTTLVKDIRPGTGSSEPRGFGTLGGKLLFSADDGSTGRELWKSDGTDSGTTRVKDIYPGQPTSIWFSYGFTVLGDAAFFNADDGVHGWELWKTDGTEAGTVLVRDLLPGATSWGGPSLGVSSDSLLFFTAVDEGNSARRLWRSDGTTAGTIRVTDPPNITLSDVTASEGQGGTALAAVRVSLSGGYSSSVSVNYATADGTGLAGTDYTATQGTITFAPGQTSRFVMVPVRGDTSTETDETFTLTLSSPANGTIIRNAAQVTIRNDDPPVAAATISQYRLYSNTTLEHLYTTDSNEYAVLGTRGWTQEGIAYRMFADGGTYNGVAAVPFYRLYNPGSLQHHWTTDPNETAVLSQSEFWVYEGIVGYILPTPATGAQALYRLAHAGAQLHLWTTDLNEYVTLQGRGWTAEGIVGYVLP
jgi:ELWxxDGT repeat protein